MTSAVCSFNIGHILNLHFPYLLALLFFHFKSDAYKGKPKKSQPSNEIQGSFRADWYGIILAGGKTRSAVAYMTVPDILVPGGGAEGGTGFDESVEESVGDEDVRIVQFL